MPQVKFTTPFGLYIDIIRSQNYQTIGSQGATLGSTPPILTPTYVQQFDVPKLAIGWDGKFGDTTVGAGFLGQTMKDGLGSTENSWMVYAHSKIVAGPFDALLNFSVGQNYDGLGFLFEGGSYAAQTGTNTHNAAVHDVTTFTGLVGIGFTPVKTLKFNAGIGGGSSSSTAANTNVVLGQGPSWSFDTYVNAQITLAKNVYVIPEYDFIDTQKSQAAVVNGVNLPLNSNGARNHVYGAQWRFDF